MVAKQEITLHLRVPQELGRVLIFSVSSTGTQVVVEGQDEGTKERAARGR